MFRRIAAAFAALALAGIAYAQPSFPNKPVKLIVPYPAGQATDIASRIVADALGTLWGQQVVVENIGGGAAIPGVVTAKEARPDGYTILAGTSAAMVVNPAIFAKLPYDTFNDFIFVGPVFRNPLIIVATDKSGYKTLAEVVAAAKKDPGKLNWSYPGTGTTQHLTGELFKYTAGIDIQTVMYKGSAQAIQDLLGDSIQLGVDGVPAMLPHIKSGRLRALASTGSTRAPLLPDVQTVAELGYKGFSGEGWGGIVIPKGTPNDLVLKIAGDLRKVMNDPAVQQRLIQNGLVVDNMPRDDWIAFAKADLIKWAEVVKRAGIKMD